MSLTKFEEAIIHTNSVVQFIQTSLDSSNRIMSEASTHASREYFRGQIVAYEECLRDIKKFIIEADYEG